MDFPRREVASAFNAYWFNGMGPSHSSIDTAFILAGYMEDEPRPASKSARISQAILDASDDVIQPLIEELLNVLRSQGYFDDPKDPKRKVLAIALSRHGHSLTPEGFVNWRSSSSKSGKPAPNAPIAKPPTLVVDTLEHSIPSTALLISSLRRLPNAMRPLVVRTRKGRVPFSITDEYDVQDAVHAMLNSFYPDVRAEERSPSSAGSSSTMDFLLKREEIAVEVKVTKPGRHEKDIKKELLVDIHDYEEHPSVKTLIAVVYDLASTFTNSAGFESDLSGDSNGLTVHVIVVGWPLPLHSSA